MKKLGKYLFYGSVLIFAIALVYISIIPDRKSESIVQKNNSETTEIKNEKPAEKVQVFLFHTTQRCITCKNIGKYAQKTVEQEFPQELKSGKIEFREINIDLPENKDLATKFKATGSALFINTIVEGQDGIKEDIQVWRLASNEQAFINYLSDKIKALL